MDKPFDPLEALRLAQAAEQADPNADRAYLLSLLSGPDEPSAPDLLAAAAQHMLDRAATYDKPDGERSMGKTVAAFNAITGRDLRESEGWLLLAVLKMVRSEQREAPHRDSIEDGISYAALYGEARVAGR
jgi:hypothetical protein